MRNIRAEAYTRADDVVVDTFSVCDPHGGALADPKWMTEVEFLIHGALQQPPAFASLWACQRHKHVASVPHETPAIAFDNETEPLATILTLAAKDRLGLLFDILESLAECDLNVVEALVDTRNDAARNVFYVTDLNGAKLNRKLMERVQVRLDAALSWPGGSVQK